MRAGDSFFDTSVILYLLSDDEGKAGRVETLLPRGGVLSIQVLNELAAVAIRKHALSAGEAREFLQLIREFLDPQPLTIETHERGLEVMERYGFSLYDSMIVASALAAGCRQLYTEDLQDGQIIEKRMKVVNPFASGSG